MISIRIPGALRPHTAQRAEVAVEGETVAEAVAHLERLHPGLRTRLLDEKGALRPYINLFHNDEDVRSAQGLATRLSSGDVLAIVPAIAGG